MRRWRLVGVMAIVFVLAVACGRGPDEDQGGGNQEGNQGGGDTTAEASDSMAVSNREDVQEATIYIEAQGGIRDIGRLPSTIPFGQGSGFIIDPSGLALTNNHVVTGSGFLDVYVQGEDEPRDATILGVSECSDLALIDIDGGGYPYLEWHDGEISSGTTVYAAGYPADDESPEEIPDYTITQGIINSTEAEDRSSTSAAESVLEHSALLRGGSSGGPLVDNDGKAVGVNYAGQRDEEGDPTGQQFAISRDEVQEILPDLEQGDVNAIGVNGEAYVDESIEPSSGIVVASVKAGSPASGVGVRGVTVDESSGEPESFDIITQLQGTDLAKEGTYDEYCSILRSRSSEDQALSIQVVRVNLEGDEVTTTTYEGELNVEGKELKKVED